MSNAEVLMNLSTLGTAGAQKLVMFGVFGAAGCLVGWLVGEPLFLVARTAETPNPGLAFSGDLVSRLNREGAKTGDVQIALIWNNLNDLDLHCVDPSGEEIYFGHRRSRSGGELDVDMNASWQHMSQQPVENIYWPANGAPMGKYQVYVDHYADHGGADPTEFRCEVGVQGKTQKFSGALSHGEPPRLVDEFTIAQPASIFPPAGAGPLLAIVLVAVWTALLSLGLAFALVIGQNRYLRRNWVSTKQAALLFGGATAVGFVAGAIGQIFYGLVNHLPALEPIGRVAGWVLLGGLMGAGMAYFIPNLPRRRAVAAGAAGGFVGAIAFMSAAGAGSEIIGRFLGAAFLGFAIGLMVALVEALSREVWLEIQYGPNESRSVTLGAQPVTIGSNREFCTVYAGGAAGIALRYVAQQGRVSCEDVAAARTFEVSPGDRRTAGKITVVVRAASKNTPDSSKPATAESARVARRGGNFLHVNGRKNILEDGTKLTASIILGLKAAAPDGVVAEVVRNPKQPETLGLKNTSTRNWWATTANGEKRQIEPGKSIKFASGTKINFGDVEGVLE
jgi:hypothetical protein